MMPWKSKRIRFPCQVFSGVMVFLYEPVPISLNPRGDKRYFILLASSRLSASSLSLGATHGCDIWKSCGRFISCHSLLLAGAFSPRENFQFIFILMVSRTLAVMFKDMKNSSV